MSAYLRLLFFFSLVVLACVGLKGQVSNATDLTQAPPVLSGNVEQVVSEFATRCHIPVLAEVAEPLPTDLRIELSACDSARFFNDIVRKNPSYSFRLHGRAVHFFDRKLMLEHQNFLNWKFKEFVLPKNVAEFKNVLTSRLGGKRRGVESKGGLVHGLYPLDLSSRSLPPNRYVDKTAREILLSVEDLDGTLLAVVVFPKRKGLTDRDLDAAFSRWQWRSVAGESRNAGSN
jgi:hypothetical protein